MNKSALSAPLIVALGMALAATEARAQEMELDVLWCDGPRQDFLRCEYENQKNGYSLYPGAEIVCPANGDCFVAEGRLPPEAQLAQDPPVASGSVLCQNDTEDPHWAPWNEAVHRTPRNGAVDFYKCTTVGAQDPPVASVPSPRNGQLLPGFPPGIQLSTTIAGMVELSPDQKLARAYALCARPQEAKESEIPYEEYKKLGCYEINAAWSKISRWTDADRAFIEEVARSLK